jgi:multidrug resistance protein
MSPAGAKPAFNRALIPILLINMVGMMGYTIIMPLMPYYAAQYEAGPVMVGLLTASYAVCSFFAGPILGQLSDRHGRRPLLLFSQLGTIIGFVIFAIGGSIWMLFLGRIIDGISGGNQVIATAYISDVTKPEERTRTFGLMGASFGVGAILGPLLGSLLSVYGISVPFWAAAGLSGVAFVLTWFLLPESLDKSRASMAQSGGIGRQFRNIAVMLTGPDTRKLFVVFLSMALGMSLFLSSIAFLMQLQLKVPSNQAGFGMAWFGMWSIIMQMLFIPLVSRRMGNINMIIMGLTSMTLGLVGVFFAFSWVALLAATWFMVFGMAHLRAPLTSLISQVAGPERQGLAMGGTTSMDSLSQILVPMVGGWLVEHVSPGAPNLLGAMFTGFGLVFFLLIARSLPRGASAPTPSRAVAAGH